MSSAYTLTWLGHSTVVIDLGGVRLVTDPLLRRRIFHLRRSTVPPHTLTDIDAVLVSHVHWDHLDFPSLWRFGTAVTVVVPRGAQKLLSDRGFRNVTELDVGDATTIGGVEVRATYADHDMGRRFRRAEAPAIGYLIASGIYFAGDTDLFEGMSELGFGLDVALLPVSGWGPTLPPGHLDPRRAAEALRLLRPRHAIPIHWGTYSPLFGRRSMSDPAAEFQRHAAELAPEVDVRLLSLGDSVTL